MSRKPGSKLTLVTPKLPVVARKRPSCSGDDWYEVNHVIEAKRSPSLICKKSSRNIVSPIFWRKEEKKKLKLTCDSLDEYKENSRPVDTAGKLVLVSESVSPCFSRTSFTSQKKASSIVSDKFHSANETIIVDDTSPPATLDPIISCPSTSTTKLALVCKTPDKTLFPECTTSEEEFLGSTKKKSFIKGGLANELWSLVQRQISQEAMNRHTNLLHSSDDKAEKHYLIITQYSIRLGLLCLTCREVKSSCFKNVIIKDETACIDSEFGNKDVSIVIALSSKCGSTLRRQISIGCWIEVLNARFEEILDQQQQSLLVSFSKIRVIDSSAHLPLSPSFGVDHTQSQSDFAVASSITRSIIDSKDLRCNCIKENKSVINCPQRYREKSNYYRRHHFKRQSRNASGISAAVYSKKNSFVILQKCKFWHEMQIRYGCVSMDHQCNVLFLLLTEDQYKELHENYLYGLDAVFPLPIQYSHIQSTVPELMEAIEYRLSDRNIRKLKSLISPKPLMPLKTAELSHMDCLFGTFTLIEAKYLDDLRSVEYNNGASYHHRYFINGLLLHQVFCSLHKMYLLPRGWSRLVCIGVSAISVLTQTMKEPCQVYLEDLVVDDKGNLLVDIFTKIHVLQEHVNCLQDLPLSPLTYIPNLSAIKNGQIFRISGRIVEVDADCSTSWSICNHCSCAKLNELDDRSFQCKRCNQIQRLPTLKCHIAVHISLSIGGNELNPSDSAALMIMHPNTLMKLLGRSVLDFSQSVDVNSVMGKSFNDIVVFSSGTLKNCLDQPVKLKLIELSLS